MTFGLASTLADMSLVDSATVIPFAQVGILGGLGSLIDRIISWAKGTSN